MKISHLLITSSLLVCAPFTFAQNLQGNGNVAHISIVALSAKPSPIYRKSTDAEVAELEKIAAEIRKKGILYKDYKAVTGVFFPPREDSIPPTSLFFTTKDKKKEKSNRVIIGFNRILPPAPVPLGKPIKLTQESESEPYLNFLPIKKPAQLLVFLTPSGDGKTPWKEAPKTNVVQLDSDEMRKYDAYVKNFSSKVVAFILGQEGVAKPIVLKPGQSRKLAVNPAVRMQRFVAIDKRKRTLIRKSIRPRKGVLNVYAFYNANPETNKGRSVGVVCSAVVKLP